MTSWIKEFKDLHITCFFLFKSTTKMANFCALPTYGYWVLSLLGIWLRVEGNVYTGMKKFQGNGHSQHVSSDFHGHCQLSHRGYICVRVDHTQAPSLYSRKAACPLEGAGMKKPLVVPATIYISRKYESQYAVKLLCAAVTWWFSLVRVPKIEWQYLHS